MTDHQRVKSRPNRPGEVQSNRLGDRSRGN